MGIHTPADKSQVAALGYLGPWYSEQCARLGVTVVDIEAAVLRGWCGDVIAELPASRVGELAGLPPMDPEIEAGIEKIKAAPVMPLQPSARDIRRRCRS